jgi:chromate reductase
MLQKVVALVGSVRKESYNLKIVEFIKARYKNVLDIEILNIKELPYFDQDLELDPPSVVKHFKKAVADADAVLIGTPEYNHSVPGVLKNAIDWLSRVDKVMIKKPTMIVGATTGMLGTIRAQMHLRQILASVSASVLPGNEVLINFVDKKLDNSGNLTDESTVSFLDKVVSEFFDWINKVDQLYK